MTHDVISGWPDAARVAVFEAGDPDEVPWVDGPPAPEDITIEPWSPAWAAQFEIARAEIARGLPDVALAIEHIGSTAVPGLPAKPILDIDLIVAESRREADYVPALTALGYRLRMRERTWYEHRLLQREGPRINLHVFGGRCPEHARHVLFRDWLRAHPSDRARYLAAKEEARSGTRDMGTYNDRKSAVLRAIYHDIFRHHGWVA